MAQLVTWLKRNNLFALILLWIVMWLFPWGKLLYFETNLYLTFILGLICLGIAIVLFIIPGALLYLSLNNKSACFYFLGIIPTGFAFSVMLIGILGLVGRIAGFSFDTVKFLFALIGFIQLIFLSIKKNHFDKVALRVSWQSFITNKILIFTLCLSFLLTFNDLLFFIDDATYLAYLTNWQHSEQLGFQNIIHESSVLELERFWLAMYPMGQALLSNLSGIPGILLFSNYLELYLVPLAVITAYWFARVLGLSRTAASVSVLIQISLYSWMIGEEWPVGTWFYNSLAEDKVSAVFHLAPVLFAYAIKYFEYSSWQSLLLAGLAGVALTLTHPVSLFFACVITLWLVLLAFIFKKVKIIQVAVIILLVAFLMSPYLAIRLFNVSSQAGFVAGTATSGGAAFELDKYTNVVSNIFYGLNPGVLLVVDLKLGNVFQFFRFTPVFIGIGALILSFIHLKKGQAYWYIFCATLLVFLVTLPYTGWIFGYFTDARLIYRASWLSPLGLGTVIILQAISENLKKLRTSSGNLLSRIYTPVRLIIFFFLFTLPILTL